MRWSAGLGALGRRFAVRVGASTIALATGVFNGSDSQCMLGPNANGAGGAAPPPAARTRFTLVNGDPARKIEDRLSVTADSPLVTSFPWLEWKTSAGPPATASVPRSTMVGALFMGTRRPSLLEISRLEQWPFISAEVAADGRFGLGCEVFRAA